MEPAIELLGISKSYGDVEAVRGLDLAIAEGEFFSLLGPSGCGKTTTMRVVAGFEEPSAGTVRLRGVDVTRTPPNKRDVNMVFQSYALFPHMSVFDNIAFGLRRWGASRTEITARVGEMIEMVELAGREKRRPAELSGGQQQRVALARALVNRPRALLLDEPLGALDLKLRQAMQIELKRIQREVRITFVYVTHDQSEALTMSDRIAVMNEGVIEQLGSPQEIYEQPSTRFVAGFIGTSNVIVHDGREIAVRPEKIVISNEKPSGDVNIVRGTVEEVVYLGTSTNYNVRTAEGGTIVVFQQNASDAAATADRGDEVWLSWHHHHSYEFGGREVAGPRQ